MLIKNLVFTNVRACFTKIIILIALTAAVNNGFGQYSNIESQPIFLSTQNFFSLSGQVFKANFNTDSVVVYLYREQTQGIVELVDSSYSLGKNGEYKFEKMVDGTYYLKARTFQHDPKFVDTYYGDDPAWITSKAIILRNDMKGRNINMLLEGNAAGMANVDGQVTHGATSPTGWEGDAGKNIPILLMNGEYLMRRTITDNNGFYSFSNVPISNYHVIVDFPGKSMLPYFIKLNTGNETASNVNFKIEQSSIVVPGPDHNTFVDGERTTDIAIFPNPFKNNIFIENSNNYHMAKIIDVTGKVAYSQTIENNNRLNLEVLKEGVYYLILENKNETLSRKIIKHL